MLDNALGYDVFEIDGPAQDLDRADLQPAHVEQVADEPVETIGLLVDRAGELSALLAGPAHVGLQEAGGRRLDRGERGAQVVRDGLQQRGAEGVGLGEAGRSGGIGLEPPSVQREGEVRQERAQHPLVIGRELGAPQHEDRAAVLRQIPPLAVERFRRWVLARRCIEDPSVIAVGEQGDRVERERAAQLVEQSGDGVGLADEDAAGTGQGSGLGARPHRLTRAGGHPVDEQARPDGAHHEDHERSDVLGFADREGVQRRDEEPVGEQRGGEGGDHGHGHATDDRDGDGGDEEQKEVGGQGDIGADRAEDDGQQWEAEDQEEPASDLAGTAGRPSAGAAGGAGCLRLRLCLRALGDHVDVEAVGASHDPVDDRPSEELVPAIPAAGPDHHLGGLLGAGELDERLGHSLPDDLPVAPPELVEQAALCQELRSGPGGEAVRGDHVDADQPSVQPPGDARGTAHELLTSRSAGDGDHHPLPGLPRLADAVGHHVGLEVLLHAIGDPEQGQLAKGGEVAGPEVVGQCRIHPLGRVDVAVSHPAAQRLGAHVDQLDLVGSSHHLVGDGLALGGSP